MRTARPLFLMITCLCLVALLTGCAAKATSTPAPTPSPTLEPPSAKYYVVASGDTLSMIAQRFGIDAVELARVNKLDDPDTLSIGQRLVVPAPTVAPTAQPAAKPTATPAK